MGIALKPLDRQVMVVTGASSGIGLATALAAAQEGTRLGVAARSKQTLDALVREIEANGAEAVAVAADVGVRADVEGIARAAIERFGRIDTWVNNAGVSVYGRLDEVSDEDGQRLFQTNFWGVVYGSLVAVEHLRRDGGALINVGSEVSEAVVPLQGLYTASKHAVKGFTDVLRIELEADGAPVSVTLIQPTAVDTPFPEHAANYMDQEPKLPTPMIQPEKVASAILDAAREPARNVKVGTMARVNAAFSKLLPSLGHRIARMQMGRQQRDEIPREREGTLFRAGESGRVHGRGDQHAANAREAREANLRPQ